LERGESFVAGGLRAHPAREHCWYCGGRWCCWRWCGGGRGGYGCVGHNFYQWNSLPTRCLRNIASCNLPIHRPCRLRDVAL
jgi:hypothetical protein